MIAHSTGPSQFAGLPVGHLVDLAGRYQLLQAAIGAHLDNWPFAASMSLYAPRVVAELRGELRAREFRVEEADR